MRALRTVILGATLLLAAPTYAGDDDAEATRARLRAAIPTSTLPVTGTVGEIPAGALEIGIAADGTYLCEGKECGLEELRAVVQRRVDVTPPGAVAESALDVVLRVDASAPWTLVQWVLPLLGQLRIYRLYFAVAPEAGGPEGVLDTFLPRSTGMGKGGPPALRLMMLPHASTPDRGLVVATLKGLVDASRVRTILADLYMPDSVPVRTGGVLTLADLALRAGARGIGFAGPPLPSPGQEKRGKVPLVGGEPGTAPWFRAWVLANGSRVPAGYRLDIAGLPFFGREDDIPVPVPPSPPRGRAPVDPSSLEALDGVADDRFRGAYPLGPDGSGAAEPTPGSASPPPKDPGSPPPADADPAVRSQHAIDLALAWLATHQSRNGSFGAEGFPFWCDGKLLETSTLDGKGKGQHDVGVTGLAVLAFLGAGVSGISETPHGKILARGLRYLRSIQDEEGCVGPRLSGHFVYGHAIAAIALVEAYRAAPAPGALATAQKALDFIALARNPKGAWRYGVQPGDDDTSVTGWMFLALDRARRVNAAAPKERPAPFTIDAASLDASRAWIEAMTDPATGRLGYVVRGSGSARQAKLVDTFPAEKVETLTAIGVFVRTGLGEDPLSIPSIVQGTNLIAALPPVWDPQDGSIDMYYWHFGAIAMAQVGGEAALEWQQALVTALAGHQRADGDACGARGSWDPIDPWGGEGGRVYATAMSVLALQATVTHARKTGAGR